MKLCCLLVAGVIGLAAGLSVPAVAQVPSAAWSGTVSHHLWSVDDEFLRNQIQSYLGRELRELRDISIVDDSAGPDYEIDVVAYRVNNSLGMPIGVAMAVVAFERFKSDFVLRLISGRVSDVAYGTISAGLKGKGAIDTFEMQTGSVDDLESICKTMVADIDSKDFDPARRSWNRLMRGR